MDSQGNAKILPDELIQQVSGGAGEPSVPNGNLPPCPDCGVDDHVIVLEEWNNEDGTHLYMTLFCRKCHDEWTARYY